MPIANCIVIKKIFDESNRESELVELWAKESGISSEHMTINIILNSEQHGNSYNVMANLLLPNMWSKKDVSLLQVGLAKALAKYFNTALSSVHVVTNNIESGMVVENGEVVEW